MSKLETILCPIDFSQASDHALHYARDLAERVGAKLELVHVLQSIDYMFTDTGGYVPPKLAEEMEARAKDRLGQVAEGVGGAQVVRGAHVVSGTPHAAIAQTAERVGADLIVMGTHGRTGIGHALLGSVAEKVVRTSKVPVLTVRRNPDTSQGTSKDAQ